MAQGLQCWNSAGVLVVELGDYNMRYMGTYSITATTASSYTVTVPGMKTTGWIAYYAPSTDVFNEWSVICNNGSMTIIYLPTGSPFAGTYSFNVYKWTV